MATPNWRSLPLTALTSSMMFSNKKLVTRTPFEVDSFKLIFLFETMPLTYSYDTNLFNYSKVISYQSYRLHESLLINPKKKQSHITTSNCARLK